MRDMKEQSTSAMDQLKDQFAGRPITRLAERRVISPTRTILTGVPCVDRALARGGPGSRKIVEIFGDESSGKSTLLCHLIAQAQRQGGVCAFIDADRTLDTRYARRLGVDVDEVLLSRPRLGEEAFDIATVLLRSGAVDVLAIDSVPMLVPRAELEGPISGQVTGHSGQMISEGMRNLAQAVHQSNALCLLTNQVRYQWDAEGERWSEVRPAARTLDLYLSHRLELTRVTTAADLEAAPTHGRIQLRIVGEDGDDAVQPLDLEYGVGIRLAE